MSTLMISTDDLVYDYCDHRTRYSLKSLFHQNLLIIDTPLVVVLIFRKPMSL